MHRKLMDGPLNAHKVDGIRRNILLTYEKWTDGPWMHGKLTEGTVIAGNVHGESRDHTES